MSSCLVRAPVGVIARRTGCDHGGGLLRIYASLALVNSPLASLKLVSARHSQWPGERADEPVAVQQPQQPTVTISHCERPHGGLYDSH